MFSIVKAISKEPAVARLASCIEAGRCPAVMSGLERVHKECTAAAVAGDSPVVIVCSDELEAERCAEDMASLTGRKAYLLTAREFTFFSADSVSRGPEHERIKTLWTLLQGEAELIIATADALMQRTVPAEKLREAAFSLSVGQEIELEAVCLKLAEAGYKRYEQVEGAGQFAVRGGILDFFSPAQDMPVRCEFFGDEIDSMGVFDVSSQRRVENLETAVILPAAETLPGLYEGGVEGLCEELTEWAAKLSRKKSIKRETIASVGEDIARLRDGGSFAAADRYMPAIYHDFATAEDYLPQDAIVFLFEPKNLAERGKNYIWRVSNDVSEMPVLGESGGFFRSWEETAERLAERPVIMLDAFTGSSYPLPVKELLHLTAKQLPSYGGSLETAAGDLAYHMKSGFSSVVLCSDRRKAEILKGFLADRGVAAALDTELERLPEKGSCAISVGSLSAGFEIPSISLVVMTEGQIAPAARRRPGKYRSNRQKLASYADLSPGDLVVHEHHGIGRFVGIFPMEVDGQRKDYIKIAYQGTDSLYVPATQLDLVSKYIGGGEDKQVKLSRLGGADWQKAKTRAKKAAQDMARGLIQLYAERKRLPGYSFSKDSPWQTEFEEGFGYAETDDQLRCVEEIKRDMESPQPMDRLLCGDVGYGKTEVAFRAIMKCVLEGRQAAMLVPTTVLAQQHFATASRRFSGYPIRIELLSRMRTPTQIKQAVAKIADGSADIVIGTHKLLMKDIKFKDLGLLVVDEEQRFGVTHKERLKELAKGVDVLTLSATPIPRTLNMVLSGLRDLSSIEEPPQDRHPVQTYVLEHDWSVLADAMKREIARGGQVYYLHNRIETIESTAAKIEKLLEGASVGVAHGQMDEETLGRVMERMVSGEIQVLVCTTIIETGIDIPNVNTLIIEDADRLGLAQLHQIRGRVGRSSRHAFAYLTFKKDKVLSETAQKRLSAIREFAEFNSGFKISMRDLEIRGAGNLLGAEQSGNMMSVGYDMYLKLLEEAVIEEKGEKAEVKTECSADFSVAAHIPEKYVPSAEQRMDLYRRIAQLRTEQDADDFADEMLDRFGDIPEPVDTLMRVALLRGEASAAGISSVTQKAGWLYFRLTDFDMEQVSALYNTEKYKRRMKIEAGDDPVLKLKLRQGTAAVAEAADFVRAYAAAKPGAESKAGEGTANGN